MARESRRGHGEWRRQDGRRVLRSHPAWEVAVRGAYADFRAVATPVGVEWPAKACGAGRWRHLLAASLAENLLQWHPVDLLGRHGGLDLDGGRDKEGRYFDPPAFQDPGGGDEVRDLASGAASDVGAVDLDRHGVLGPLHFVGGEGQGHDRLQLGGVVVPLGGVGRVGVTAQHLEWGARPTLDVVDGLLVRGDNAVLAARLDGHVADGHPLLDAKSLDGRAGELHGHVRRPVHADVADDREDDVLGHDATRQFPVHDEPVRLWDFDKKLARAHHETRVRVADAGRELAYGAVRARVRVGPEQHLAGAAVPLFWQRHMADSRIRARARIIEVRELLLFSELPKYVYVAQAFLVFGEDVVVGDDHHFPPVPDGGVFAELPLHDPDCAWPADVMRHEDVG